MSDNSLLTIKEVSEIFRVKPRTVRRWIKDGKIEAYPWANRYWIRQSEIDSLLESQRGRRMKPTPGSYPKGYNPRTKTFVKGGEKLREPQGNPSKKGEVFEEGEARRMPRY